MTSHFVISRFCGAWSGPVWPGADWHLLGDSAGHPALLPGGVLQGEQGLDSQC